MDGGEDRGRTKRREGEGEMMNEKRVEWREKGKREKQGGGERDTPTRMNIGHVCWPWRF